MNRLGMAIPYNEMNLFDTTLAKRAIETTRQNIVTVNDAIKCNAIFQGPMDNFDHDENTQLVNFVSHDTILMLIQNLQKDSVPV